MNPPTRREFLVRSAAAGACALGAGRLTAFGADEKPAQMAIAKWSGPKELPAAEMKQAAVKLTEKLIEGMGGMGRFVGKGDVVWVKPNIAWDRTPELAANTNPDVVAAIVRLCLDAGAKTVKVGDNPCDLAAKSYASSGIPDAVKPLGAEVVLLDRERVKDTDIRGERVKTLPMWPEILDCDVLINVPVVKHHGLAGATMCMKNYMGVMENRRTFHQAIPECLADLNRFIQTRWGKAPLCILDGVRILTAHGPRGGNPDDVQLKLQLAAGTDAVALDAWGAGVLGRAPEEIKSVPFADKAGLGKMDYRRLAPKEIAVS